MKNFKELFPIFGNYSGLVYLDSGASAQKPLSVIKGMDDFYSNDYANIHRGLYRLSETSSQLYDEVRGKVASFIGAEHKKEIIFTKGTTEAVNLLASSYSHILNSGDVVILSELEHHSNLVPWQNMVKEKGIVLKFIPVLASGELDYEWLRDNISEEVKLVCVSGQSNVIGLKNDIEKIVDIAHGVNAKVFIDAAQLVSHYRINVSELDVDYLAFSSHKIYGPTGIGILYGKKDLLSLLPPYQFGGDMVDRVSLEKFTIKDIPEKFEAGTPPIVEAYGLGLAIDFLNEFGMEPIENELLALTAYTISQLKLIEGVKFLNHTDSNGIVTFVIEGVSSFDIGTLLGENNICVRVGKHCTEPLHNKFGLDSTVRLSLGIYNDKVDIDKFIAVLNKVLLMLKV